MADAGVLDEKVFDFRVIDLEAVGNEHVFDATVRCNETRRRHDSRGRRCEASPSESMATAVDSGWLQKPRETLGPGSQSPPVSPLVLVASRPSESQRNVPCGAPA